MTVAFSLKYSSPIYSIGTGVLYVCEGEEEGEREIERERERERESM